MTGRYGYAMTFWLGWACARLMDGQWKIAAFDATLGLLVLEVAYLAQALSSTDSGAK